MDPQATPPDLMNPNDHVGGIDSTVCLSPINVFPHNLFSNSEECSILIDHPTTHSVGPVVTTPRVIVDPGTSSNGGIVLEVVTTPRVIVDPGPSSNGGIVLEGDEVESHPLLVEGAEVEPYYCWITPNGTKIWCPNVSLEFKPIESSEFSTFDDVIAMYQKYADVARFSIRKGQTKNQDGVVVHKYLRCNKAGKPQTKRKFDTMEERSMYIRQSTFTVCDCKAHIRVNFCKEKSLFVLSSFGENHNHSLVDSYNRDLTKISRKLTFSTKKFIHNMSLNRIGPIRSHRFMVSMLGGHHNVHGTVTDFKNFSRSMRIYIGDKHSQLVVDRMLDRSQNLPDFFFDLIVTDGKLRSIFWADEISKLNYQAFGDVLAFDVTYQTNKYNMIFVPFTGVDHHKHCVTFGAGLIHSETIDSYKWLLESFLQAHGKQPTMVFSDQDPSMRQVVQQVFPDSRHRLCMWHVMKKLPAKIPGSLLDNTTFRADLHRIVWSIYIRPDTFETTWHQLLETFSLQDHEWLTQMFEIRDRWVPAYFRDIPMCCLMKTTARCESSNSSFKVNSSSANTLVQFMLCFETRLDSQRYRQRVSEYKSMQATFMSITGLPIEKHAFEFYTQTIFLKVSKRL